MLTYFLSQRRHYFLHLILSLPSEWPWTIIMGVLWRDQHFLIFPLLSQQEIAECFHVFHSKAEDLLSKIKPAICRSPKKNVINRNVLWKPGTGKTVQAAVILATWWRFKYSVDMLFFCVSKTPWFLFLRTMSFFRLLENRPLVFS